MNKFQNALYRFMSGRYGSDQLNNFLLIFALILLILNLFVIRNPYLTTIIWIILIINIFRTYSRNILTASKLLECHVVGDKLQLLVLNVNKNLIKKVKRKKLFCFFLYSF